jgi:hypothetical protein
MVCASLSLRTQVGDDCDRSSLPCDPLARLVCDPATLTCQGGGDGGQGSACFTSDFQLPCNSGLYCKKPPMASSTTAGTCQPLLQDGDTCETSNDCVGGSCSDAGICEGRDCSF